MRSSLFILFLTLVLSFSCYEKNCPKEESKEITFPPVNSIFSTSTSLQKKTLILIINNQGFLKISKESKRLQENYLQYNIFSSIDGTPRLVDKELIPFKIIYVHCDQLDHPIIQALSRTSFDQFYVLLTKNNTYKLVLVERFTGQENNQYKIVF